MTKKQRKKTLLDPRVALADTLTGLRTGLPEKDHNELRGELGMTFPQVVILEAMGNLSLTGEEMAAVLVKNFKAEWGEDPQWFTTYSVGESVYVFLGPVRTSQSFSWD